MSSSTATFRPRRAASGSRDPAPHCHHALHRAIACCREAVTIDQMLARIHDVVVEDLGFSRAIVCSLTDRVVTPPDRGDGDPPSEGCTAEDLAVGSFDELL